MGASGSDKLRCCANGRVMVATKTYGSLLTGLLLSFSWCYLFWVCSSTNKRHRSRQPAEIRQGIELWPLIICLACHVGFPCGIYYPPSKLLGSRISRMSGLLARLLPLRLGKWFTCHFTPLNKPAYPVLQPQESRLCLACLGLFPPFSCTVSLL
jgi:hypothetical protein